MNESIKTGRGYISQSKSVEWETPQDFFDKLDDEFHFTVDVASDDDNAKCELHYTKESDGLTKNWGGRECGAIHHMAKKCLNGLKKHIKNGTMLNVSLC